MNWTSRSDGELLRTSASEPDAFGELYRRYEAIVVAFLARRAKDPEVVADLTADTFATALLNADRFQDTGAPAVGWLLGIARNLLLESWRKHRNAERALRRLGGERPPLSDPTLERLEALVDCETATPALRRALARLPEGQRAAVEAYVLDNRSYAELADELGISEATIRQRVSRGLARLRTSLEGSR